MEERSVGPRAFSHSVAILYLRLLHQRTIVTDISEERRLNIEEAWAALVQRTTCWSVGVKDLGAAVDKVVGNGSYQQDDVHRAMQLLDLNGDGLIDYYEFKAYMLTTLSPYPDSAAPPPAQRQHGNRRGRRGPAERNVPDDFIAVGTRRLSDIILAHLNIAISEFQPRAKTGAWNKARNPFSCLPNYDPELSTFIRSKSINIASKTRSRHPLNLRDMVDRLATSINAIEGTKCSPGADPEQSLDSSVGRTSCIEDMEEQDASDQAAESRRRRQQQLLKEEQAMMRQSHHHPVPPQEGEQQQQRQHHRHQQQQQQKQQQQQGDCSPKLLPVQTLASPQQPKSRLVGMFKKIGKLFSKEVEQKVVPSGKVSSAHGTQSMQDMRCGSLNVDSRLQYSEQQLPSLPPSKPGTVPPQEQLQGSVPGLMYFSSSDLDGADAPTAAPASPARLDTSFAAPGGTHAHQRRSNVEATSRFCTPQQADAGAVAGTGRSSRVSSSSIPGTLPDTAGSMAGAEPGPAALTKRLSNGRARSDHVVADTLASMNASTLRACTPLTMHLLLLSGGEGAAPDQGSARQQESARPNGRASVRLSPSSRREFDPAPHSCPLYLPVMDEPRTGSSERCTTPTPQDRSSNAANPERATMAGRTSSVEMLSGSSTPLCRTGSRRTSVLTSANLGAASASSSPVRPSMHHVSSLPSLTALRAQGPPGSLRPAGSPRQSPGAAAFLPQLTTASVLSPTAATHHK